MMVVEDGRSRTTDVKTVADEHWTSAADRLVVVSSNLTELPEELCKLLYLEQCLGKNNHELHGVRVQFITSLYHPLSVLLSVPKSFWGYPMLAPWRRL